MPDGPSKATCRWQGPYKVEQRLSKYTYVVVGEEGEIRTLHANKLRQFVPRIGLVGVVNAEDVEFGDVREYPVYDGGGKSVAQFDKELNQVDLTHLLEGDKQKVLALLRKYRRVFSDNPGRCD